MIRRTLFRQAVLKRFLGPFPTDEPLRLAPARRGLLWLAAGLLAASGLVWLW